jgi:uncharacterized membrane protein
VAGQHNTEPLKRNVRWLGFSLKAAVMKIVLTMMALLSIVAAQSQSRIGHFRGVVTDVKGSAIKEALVIVEGPNSKQTLRTNRLGHFEVELSPGTYAITIEKSGFANYQLTNLKIESTETREFTFRLERRNRQS